MAVLLASILALFSARTDRSEPALTLLRVRRARLSDKIRLLAIKPLMAIGATTLSTTSEIAFSLSDASSSVCDLLSPETEA